ncbi:Unknown protein [Striga hermonthica]|uniref:At1g61320/AtMIF1 LRR domain-containing protein n=1 Tax=Striga hermonthica TaxID=68872 RepID=A0A9N7QZP0_STRHE|nr:Unknown protein [Striga hermonthica]
MEKIIEDPEFRSVEREKYVKWVDSVLQSHRGSTVKELRICFSLVKSAGKSITKWLEFAFERHTEKLELNLSEGDCLHNPNELYAFPQELCSNISSDHPYKSSGLFGCVLLEDVPMLTRVNVTSVETSSMYVERLIPTLLCCLSQLEILTFDTCCKRELLSMLKFPMMPKLKKLVIIEALHGVDSSLLGLSHFISASPNLREFEIQQRWSTRAERSNNEIQKGLKHFPLHQHLNVIRFLGYYGCPSDVELVNYLLENCVTLKEIIVDTQNPRRMAYEPLDSEELKLAEIAKVYAKLQLEPLVPKHISLFLC